MPERIGDGLAPGSTQPTEELEVPVYGKDDSGIAGDWECFTAMVILDILDDILGAGYGADGGSKVQDSHNTLHLL